MGLINNLIQFVSGTKAVSSEVNQNFETLRSGHNNQENRIVSLENNSVNKSGDTMTGGLDMGLQKITSLGDGNDTGDAINLGQLNDHVSSPIHDKYSVRQTVLYAPIDSAGQPNFIYPWSSGMGLDIGFDGAGIVTSFSEGFDSNGIVEHIGYLDSNIQLTSFTAGSAVTGITRAGTTVTVNTANPHGLEVGWLTIITGASQAEYNGTFAVTAVLSSTSFTYTCIGSPATPATGTITESPLLFLYFETDLDGNISANYSHFAPAYSYKKPAAAVVDQHCFVIPEMKMYRYNGASWDIVRRVFIGEILVNSSNITTAANYALRGKYYSDWFSVASGTIYTKNHNLGVNPEYVDLKVIARKNNLFTPVNLQFSVTDGVGSGKYGAKFGAVNRYSTKVSTASGYFLVAGTGYGDDEVGATDSNTSSGEVFIVAQRNW